MLLECITKGGSHDVGGRKAKHVAAVPVPHGILYKHIGQWLHMHCLYTPQVDNLPILTVNNKTIPYCSSKNDAATHHF